MPHLRIVTILGFVALMFRSFSSDASILRDMTLAEMVADADDIVVCTVLSVDSKWDSDHRNILTSIQIKVDENWKGTPPKDGKVTFVQQGGSVGDMEMSVQGMPNFSKGERSLLFFHGGARRFVVGMNMGKRPLQFDPETKKWLVKPATREGILRVQRQAADTVVTVDSDKEETLDSLRAKVRSLLAR